ncbi:MAG: prephenate dehydratase [Candidatus Muirbacterium halophilum]|nr:prephenate dehydratase [Candidatus Muirbacterium halophilum]MCK9476459.1 prephenate dehydratase [Candidatus Muirbacterium halophilum]
MIGFQGIKGSFSHQAIYNFFGKDEKSKGFLSFEEVFEALKNNIISRAFLPVENSIAGSVAPVYDLLLKYNCFIINEHYQKIDHYLLAKKQIKLKDIQKVYSHPVALEQCRNFISENKFIPVQMYDTAGAAKFISNSDENLAAISPKLCSSIYNLHVLSEKIQSNENNYTRFVEIHNQNDKLLINPHSNKTSMAFKPVNTEKYGALSNCLDIFTKYKLNLTKVESRPDSEKLWEYVFFIDISASIYDKNFIKCLSVLEDFTEFYKVFGTYKECNKKIKP